MTVTVERPDEGAADAAESRPSDSVKRVRVPRLRAPRIGRAGLLRGGAPLEEEREVGRAVRAWRVVTPLARSLAVLALVSWLIGWRLGWAEFMVLAVGCIAVLLLALPFAFGRPMLDVQLELGPSRVTVGQRASGRVHVRNSARGRLLPVRIELPVGRGVARFDLPSLAVGADHEEIFRVPTRRRAVLSVGPVRSVRGDALGLYRRDVEWSDVEELIVHPKTVNLNTLGSGFLRDLEGQVTNHLSSSDVAFHTLRDYVPRRFVHWRTSARTGKLMVRQFVDTRRSHAAVVIDTDPTSYLQPGEPGTVDGDEFELSVAAAASLALRVVRDEQTLSLMTGRGRLACSTGQQVLDSCARVESDAGGGLPAAASALTTDAADASIVFLFTGSAATVGSLRRAVRGVSPDARVLAVRARLGGTSAFRESGGISLLELAALHDLAGLVRAAVR